MSPSATWHAYLVPRELKWGVFMVVGLARVIGKRYQRAAKLKKGQKMSRAPVMQRHAVALVSRYDGDESVARQSISEFFVIDPNGGKVTKLEDVIASGWLDIFHKGMYSK